jgi:transglutaminase-like putative cysteine protease
MAIHVTLNHQTHYRYDRVVALGPQIVRLRPAPHCRTRILSYSLRVTPEKHFINWQQDPQANFLARLVFPEATGELRIEVDLVAEMAVFNPFDFFLEPAAERFPFEYDPSLDHELEPFRRRGAPTPRFEQYVTSARNEVLGTAAASRAAEPQREGIRTIDFLVELNRLVWRDIKYVIRLEPGVQTPVETLVKGTGSCAAWGCRPAL